MQIDLATRDLKCIRASSDATESAIVCYAWNR